MAVLCPVAVLGTFPYLYAGLSNKKKYEVVGLSACKGIIKNAIIGIVAVVVVVVVGVDIFY